MKLDILYFGLVAEAIKCVQEEFVLESKITVKQLKDLLINKYAELGKLSYQIAVNQQLVNPQTVITEDCEIAILPPFAGG